MEIDERKRTVLKAVIHNFVTTGKPIGSKAVCQKYGFGISPATIRNEMAILENEGFMIQPHTSAGRIPTDRGYRYFVDSIMETPNLSSMDVKAIKGLFAARTKELEELLLETSALLSRLTSTTAFLYAPRDYRNQIHHVELIYLSTRQAMLIVITEDGRVGRELIMTREQIDREVVVKVGNLFRSRLRGKRLEEIDREKVLAEMRPGSEEQELAEIAQEALVDYLGQMEQRVYVGGRANMVRQIDAVGMERVKALLEALDEQYFLMELLRDVIEDRELTIRIGRENQIWELQSCTFVGKSYLISSGAIGSLGILGPMGIDYPRTIGLVECVARNLSLRLEEENN